MLDTLQNPQLGATTGSEDGDRFSNLPDPIIHQIFSSFETIDIIRLSAVSRKWRYLWISIPYLNLDINTVWSKPLQKWSLHTLIAKFKDFVNWVLMSQDGSIDIQRCRLFCFHVAGDNTLYRWINVVTRRNVQEFDLNMVSYSPFELPRCLVICESLMSFKLCFDTPRLLKLPTFGGFSRLKTLDFLRVEFSDYNLLRDFISKCPFLEDLIMEACVFRDFEKLEISSINLKNLTVHNNISKDRGVECDGLQDCELKVACPNLVSFNFFGPSAPDYFLENLNSLKEAYIYLDSNAGFPDIEDCDYEIWKILQGVCNTEVLKLSFGYSEFHYPLSVTECFPISFCNLKTLVLFVGIEADYILTLLDSSPNLEALEIIYEWYEDEDEDFDYDEDYDFWKIPDRAISCLTYHLKMVELVDVVGRRQELELVRFLLKNGHVLQKMNINWVEDLKNPGVVIPKVMQFPRSSSNVALTFLDPE